MQRLAGVFCVEGGAWQHEQVRRSSAMLIVCVKQWHNQHCLPRASLFGEHSSERSSRGRERVKGGSRVGQYR